MCRDCTNLSYCKMNKPGLVPVKGFSQFGKYFTRSIEVWLGSGRMELEVEVGISMGEIKESLTNCSRGE